MNRKNVEDMLSLIPKKSKYFRSEEFTLLQGDSFRLLKKIEPKSIDMIFADPPYFLSSGGISCKNGKQVSVDKGEWDITKTIEDRIKYHRTWIGLCRDVLTDNGTIWISATLHSAYAIGVALEMEGFSIINKEGDVKLQLSARHPVSYRPFPFAAAHGDSMLRSGIVFFCLAGLLAK